MPGRYGNLGIGSYGGTPEEEDAIRRRVLRRGYGMADQLGLPEIDNPLADQIGKPPGLWSEDGSINPEGLSTLGTYLSGLGQGFLANSGYEPGVAPSFGQGLGAGVAKAEENYSSRLRQQVSDRVTGYQLKRQQRQDALEEQERQRQAAAQEQQQQLLGQLGPEYQTLAALGDGPAAQALKAQLFPDPVKPEYRNVGNQLLEIIPGQQPRVVASAPREAGKPEYREFGGKLYEIAPGQQPRVVAEAPAGSEKPIEVGGALVARQPDGTYKPVYQGPQSSPQFATLTPEEVKAQNLPPGQAYQRNTVTGEIERIPGPAGGITVGPDGTVQIGGPAGVGAPTSATLTAAQRTGASYQNITKGLDDLENLVKQNGTELYPTEAKGAMEQAMNNVLLEAKEMYNLGVLNGPDLDIITSILGDPTSLSANITSMLPGTGNPALKKIQQFRKIMERKLQSAQQSVGAAPAAPAAGRPPGANLYDGVPGAQPMTPNPAGNSVKPPVGLEETDAYLRDLGL